MNFARNAASVLMTSVVSVPLSILSSVILARWLALDERGVYALAMTFSGLTVTLTQLGWSSASVYRIRRVGSAPAEVLGAGIVASVIISLLTVVVIAIAFDPIQARFLPGVSIPIVALTVAMVPVQLVGRVIGGVARAVDRFDIANSTLILNKVGGVVVSFVALVLLGWGVFGVLAALLGLSIAVLVWRTGTLARHTGLALRFRRDELTDGLRFGLKSWVQSLAGQIHERVDILMLAWLLEDQEQIAIYSIAVGLSTFLKLVPEAIGSALFPKLAGVEAAEAGVFAARVCRHVTLWVAISTVGLAAVGPWGLPLLYGASYQPSVAPFLWLLPGVGALTIYRVLSRFFVARDRQGVTIGIQAVSVALNLTLNALLIPRYGVVGCASASLVSYIAEAVLIAVVFRSVTGHGFAAMFIVRRDELAHHGQWLLARLRRIKR